MAAASHLALTAWVRPPYLPPVSFSFIYLVILISSFEYEKLCFSLYKEYIEGES